MIENNQKEFILEFFKDCKIQEKGGALIINGVPKDFEEFFGKKSPYKLVFDLDSYSKIKDSELVTQGSYLLIAIKDYLSNKGQTSLLKLDIKLELSKKDKRFKSIKIINSEQETFGFLSEFYFLSIYQYLNEKKQIINKFLLKDEKIIDLNLNKFKISKGNKEKIPNINLKKQYDVVKKKLNLQVSKEMKKVRSTLNIKLEKELSRIKSYYHNQIKEKDEEIEKCEEKIKLLENKVKHTFYDRDIDTFNRMIRESKARLEMLQRKNYKQRLLAEESFHVNDEVEKYVLSIKNNLINSTVYYYPIYKLTILKKGKKSVIKYDPVFDKIV